MVNISLLKRFSSADNDVKAMDILDGDIRKNNQELIIYPKEDSINQEWIMDGDLIINPVSRMAITIKDGGDSDGTQVVISENKKGQVQYQRWEIDYLTVPTRSLPFVETKDQGARYYYIFFTPEGFLRCFLRFWTNC